MALAQCFQDVICGLSAATRNAMVTLLQGYIAQLDLYLVQYEAKLLYLDIASGVPQQLNAIAQVTINQVKAGANIIPLDLAANCFEVGSLNLAVQTNLDALLINANIVANDLSRLLSFRDEVEAVIEDLRATRDLYVAVLAQIDVCAESEDIT